MPRARPFSASMAELAHPWIKLKRLLRRQQPASEKREGALSTTRSSRLSQRGPSMMLPSYNTDES